jgi:copper chaperone
MEKTLRLSIEGMHCGACVSRITSALKGLDGVEVGVVEVGSASMKFDPTIISTEKIAAAVDHIGFSARVAG